MKREASRVVLLGRPNVGKSTLFNRLTGARRAIVTPVPGTTRDTLEAPIRWRGVSCVIVDTGGLDGASTDPLHEAVAARGMRALDGAALAVLLVDGRTGLVPADHEVAQRIRQSGVPVVVAVNKIDDPASEASGADVHRLGFDPVIPVSAEHGLGAGDLLDEVIARLPARAGRAAAAPAPDEDEIALAVVGRPNVGKSSLINRVAREERVLVSDRAGTTRDVVDTVVRWRGRRLRLVDTAGRRRPGRVAAAGIIEAASVAVARRAVARADVAVVVLDATAPLTPRDAAIAGEAERAGCGLVCAANKWDVVHGRDGFAARFDAEARDVLKFADYAPILHVSARTGVRVERLLEVVEQVERARATHVPTGELNRFLQRVTRRHPPSSPGKREVKIQYATQVGVKPPRFVLFLAGADRLHFSYERFVRNRLREAFGFQGSPLVIQVRARRR